MKPVTLVMASFLLTASAFGEEGDYRITAVSGNVAVIPAESDDASPVKPGLPLAAGDRVVTDSGARVEIAAKEGTIFELGEKTSFSVEESRPGWGTFRLFVGRVLAKFAPASPGSAYRVKTPVAVAAVRGTELALMVADDGALDAGVVEGEVAFRPVEEDTAAPAWKEEVIGASQGLTAKPEQAPARLDRIPPPLVADLARFPSLRERVPALRSQWKELPAQEKIQLRQAALRERVTWRVPEKLREKLTSPRQRVAPPNRPPRHPRTPPAPRQDR